MVIMNLRPDSSQLNDIILEQLLTKNCVVSTEFQDVFTKALRDLHGDLVTSLNNIYSVQVSSITNFKEKTST